MQNHEPEKAAAVIIGCLRAHYSSMAAADLLRGTNDEMAWPNLLSTARWHGIVPLVYETLSQRSSELPENAWSNLQREFRQNATNSFLYAAELVRLTNHLKKQGIPTIAFKGPTLAVSLYGKLSLRTVRDLDLLVPRDQLDLALESLRVCGYQPVSGLGGAPPRVSGNSRKHILLFHESLGFNVELHWVLTERSFAFPLRFEQLWAERCAVSVMGQPVATLSREHTLFMMCAHGTSHCWWSLKWICDIAQAVLAFPRLDWNRVMTRARASGCHRMLSVGLALASDVCGVKLPGELEPSVTSEKVRAICRDAQRRLFAEREPPINLERTLILVRSRERVLDRLRILLRFIGPELKPNARDRALVSLPGRLRVLYFPFRLVRIMLFCWRRAILPIAKSALDHAAACSAPIPSK